MTFIKSPNVPIIRTPDWDRLASIGLNQALNKTDPLQLSGTVLTNNADFNLAPGYVYKIDSVQVVGPRSTGWTADTGTAEKTAKATYTAGSTLTFTDPPTAAEMTALATRLAAVETAVQNSSRGKKALKDALLTHGLLGA